MYNERIPTPMAVLLCQTTILDQQSRCRSLINVIHKIAAPSTPVPFGGGLYIRLVDGSGDYRVRIRLVRMRDDALIVEFPLMPIQWKEPGPLEVGINFGNISLQEFGQYEFQVFIDDSYIGRAAFSVEQINVPKI